MCDKEIKFPSLQQILNNNNCEDKLSLFKSGLALW